MRKYDIIYEELQTKVDCGELTVEDAQKLNEIAYEKYGNKIDELDDVTESSGDDSINDAIELISEGVLTAEDVCELFEITEKTGNNEVLIEAIKRNKTKVSDYISDIRSLIKNKEYEKAITKVNSVEDELKAVKTSIMDIKTDLEDDLISVGLSLAVDVSEMAVSSIPEIIDLLNEDSQSELDNAEGMPKQAIKTASAIMGLNAALSFASTTLDFALSKNSGKETNEYKKEAIRVLNRGINMCYALKDKIKRKQKFDAFMKKHKNKLIKAGTAAGVAAGVAAGAVVAKRYFDKKKNSKESTDVSTK